MKSIWYAISELNMNAFDTLYLGDINVHYESSKVAHIDHSHVLWGYGVYDHENIIKLE